MRDDIQQFEVRGATILCIAPHRIEDAREIATELALPFPVLADEDRSVFAAYTVVSRVWSLGQRPGVYMIDPGGHICFAHVGTQQWDLPSDQKLLACLDTACAETSAA